MTKPDYQSMSRTELKQYVLNHRNDDEALNELVARRPPNTVTYPADLPTEEVRKLVEKKVEEVNHKPKS